MIRKKKKQHPAQPGKKLGGIKTTLVVLQRQRMNVIHQEHFGLKHSILISLPHFTFLHRLNSFISFFFVLPVFLNLKSTQTGNTVTEEDLNLGQKQTNVTVAWFCSSA